MTVNHVVSLRQDCKTKGFLNFIIPLSCNQVIVGCCTQFSHLRKTMDTLVFLLCINILIMN